MRQKARRHAHVRIRNGLDVDRRQPTDDEIRDLAEGISRNAVPKFGLVKLSAMRLDDGVEPPAWFERIIRWPKCELIPMVHLAALRRRDRPPRWPVSRACWLDVAGPYCGLAVPSTASGVAHSPPH